MKEQTEQKTVSWDALNDVYVTIANGIIKIGISAVETANILKQKGISEDEEIVIHFNQLNEDITTINSELKTLHELHSDKTGTCTEQDISNCISIYLGYQNIESNIHVLLLPVLANLTERILQLCPEEMGNLNNLEMSPII